MILFPFRYLWWLLVTARRALGKPPEYVEFILEEDLPALPDPPRPWWQRFTGGRARLSVKELGERFDAIARDARIKGVVLHLRGFDIPMATWQDLRELVEGLRKRGKRVVAWAPFYGTGTYYLACACDEILLMPTGSVQPLGVAATGFFLADGLARFGLAADFVQISPYKSAADPLTKSQMPNEYRQQMTWLLDSNYEEILAAIAAGRLLDRAGAKRLIDGSPYGDTEVVEKHVADAVVSEDDLPKRLGGAIGTWERAQSKMRPLRPTLRRGRYVAIMRIEGTIIDGRSGALPVRPPIAIPLIGDNRAGDLTVVQAARQIAADKRAAAVLLYVNSRGGSSTASEAMRQAIMAVAARKPVVVVMGPFAASGGYWVSMPGRWIVARPGTLTGSIGVLSGKLVTGGIWSKLLFNRETIAFGDHVQLDTDERRFTDEERRIVEAEVQRVYKVFVEQVAAARKMKPEEVQEIAQGKVWTGTQALDRYLVDELGGLEAGLRKARSLARLKEDAPAREPRAPRRTVPPLAAQVSPAADWLGYLAETLALLMRARVLAVMEYFPRAFT